MAEFYSANLAAEVMKGLHQKARHGGTIGKAYLGYLNVRTIVNGVEKRTVEIDPERGPLMAWAPIELMKQEQERIGSQLAALDRRLARLDARVTNLTGHLEHALQHLTNLDLAYVTAAESVMRRINQAVFERIEVGDEGATEGVPTGLYGALLDPRLRRAARNYVKVTETVPSHLDKQHHNGHVAASNGHVASSNGHLRIFLTRARRAAGVKRANWRRAWCLV